jgi:hypothetical protein
LSKKKKKAKKEYSEGVHIFVMIHGLDSSYTELIPLMNEISIVNSNADFIMPESIHREKSRSKIEKLGKDIAKEILEKLDDRFEYNEIGKITFI